MSLLSSLSSLLPRPKHTADAVEISSETKDLIAVINESELVDNGSEVDTEQVTNKSVSLDAFLPLRQKFPDVKIPLPSNNEIRHSYERTKAIFDKILREKLNPQGTSSRGTSNVHRNTKAVEYHGVQNGTSGTGNTLQIVDRQIDPLQPNLFKVKKMVAPPTDEPFAPVLHSSDDKNVQLTKEERARWNIPSAISNWKNPNGYAIALDKRVAVDGSSNRGSGADRQISDGFTKLFEALDGAEKEARREVKLRLEAKRMLAEQDGREKEEKLRLLALKAREERRNLGRNLSSSNDDESEELRHREADRKQRRLQMEKELRQSKMNTANRLRALAAKQNREISEKVILGAAKANDTKDIQYDSRFFSKAANANATRSGEQVYDSPLFAQAGINTMYRPNFSNLADAQRTDDIEQSLGKQVYDNISDKRSREGPVEFTDADTPDRANIKDVQDNELNPPKKHRAQ
ncbi:LAME_0B01684g1_1 [Lachancea meyersii CBS 8951]|uniref:Pre-mRNA-processing protein 45 n=1 Tax=Lachancea meyersii CBS 8951 TaxID=1266667 RepID=A0A1G4IT47_9SACH|nr:LAME_0B01684g1_1 [Lachancea meyersii CBS 8951]